jgi:hypothetical protein
MTKKLSADGLDMYELLAKAGDNCENLEYYFKLKDTWCTYPHTARSVVAHSLLYPSLDIGTLRLKQPRSADGHTLDEFMALCDDDLGNVDWVKCDYFRFDEETKAQLRRDFELDMRKLADYRIRPKDTVPSWCVEGAWCIAENGNRGSVGQISSDGHANVQHINGLWDTYEIATLRPAEVIPYATTARWIEAAKKHGAFVRCVTAIRTMEASGMALTLRRFGFPFSGGTKSYIVVPGMGEDIIIEMEELGNFRWADDNSPIGDIVPCEDK